jgi:hypothetical protein
MGQTAISCTDRKRPGSLSELRLTATKPFHKEVLGVARFDSVETESFTHISILLRADMRLHTRDHSQSQTTKVTEQIVRCPSGLLIDET